MEIKDAPINALKFVEEFSKSLESGKDGTRNRLFLSEADGKLPSTFRKWQLIYDPADARIAESSLIFLDPTFQLLGSEFLVNGK